VKPAGGLVRSGANTSQRKEVEKRKKEIYSAEGERKIRNHPPPQNPSEGEAGGNASTQERGRGLSRAPGGREKFSKIALAEQNRSFHFRVGQQKRTPKGAEPREKEGQKKGLLKKSR